MLFTVAIPAFKNKFFDQCIESVLNQTFPDFELIVLNDLSPEPIKNTLSKYHDKRIIYLENSYNVGPERLVENWNRCLYHAKGKFLIILGDDDMFEPDYLQSFADLIVAYPTYDIFHCRSKIINDKSVAISLTPSWPEFETVYDNIWHRLFNGRLQYISDFVYRTEKLKSVGGFFYLPLAWGSDDISSFSVMVQNGIIHTNNTLLNYRQHSETLSSSGNISSKMMATIEKGKWLTDFLSKVPPNSQDKIVHKNISARLDFIIRKQKILLIKYSLSSDSFFNCFHWFRYAKKYKIKYIDIFYSLAITVISKFYKD